MLRLLFCAVLGLGLCVTGLRAENQAKNNKDQENNAKSAQHQKAHKNHQHQREAKILNVNPQEGTVTVQFKDKKGHVEKRTFHLTGEERYLDSTGRVAALDVFQSGQYVLVVEEEGRLKEMRQADQQHAGKKHKDQNASESSGDHHKKAASSENDNNQDKNKNKNKNKGSSENGGSQENSGGSK